MADYLRQAKRQQAKGTVGAYSQAAGTSDEPAEDVSVVEPTPTPEPAPEPTPDAAPAPEQAPAPEPAAPATDARQEAVDKANSFREQPQAERPSAQESGAEVEDPAQVKARQDAAVKAEGVLSSLQSIDTLADEEQSDRPNSVVQEKTVVQQEYNIKKAVDAKAKAEEQGLTGTPKGDTFVEQFASKYKIKPGDPMPERFKAAFMADLIKTYSTPSVKTKELPKVNNKGPQRKQQPFKQSQIKSNAPQPDLSQFMRGPEAKAIMQNQQETQKKDQAILDIKDLLTK